MLQDFDKIGLDFVYLSDGENFIPCIEGCLFNRVKHIEYPRFPILMLRYTAQKAVIIRFLFDDIFAQIKDRQFQKMFAGEVKNIQYPAGAAVAICKGVDGLKLIMDYGDALEIPVVTDDSQMRELGKTFEIEVWSLLDVLKIMYKSKRIELSDIKTLLKYLKYIKD